MVTIDATCSESPAEAAKACRRCTIYPCNVLAADRGVLPSHTASAKTSADTDSPSREISTASSRRCFGATQRDRPTVIRDFERAKHAELHTTDGMTTLPGQEGVDSAARAHSATFVRQVQTRRGSHFSVGVRLRSIAAWAYRLGLDGISDDSQSQRP